MQKIRTRRFHVALCASLVLSAVLLSVILIFGRTLSREHFSLLTGIVFFVFALAAASFLTVSFAPYFQGEKRWFVIPTLLTALFFVSVVLLWQLPLPTEAVI